MEQNKLSLKPKRFQSVEVAPEPIPAQKFDTVTPAVGRDIVRRFSLDDLPRYADKLFPLLKTKYPHLNDRMYGGWLRGCISDNSCLFICIDGAVLMAHIMHWPMSPDPLVWFAFCFGRMEGRELLYEHMFTWAAGTGAREVYVEGADDDLLTKLKSVRGQAKEPQEVIVNLFRVG